MTTWLAAAVTTGSGLNCRAGGVVMLNAEDDPEDTIRPRLEAAGADLDRVWIEPNVSLDPNMISARASRSAARASSQSTRCRRSCPGT